MSKYDILKVAGIDTKRLGDEILGNAIGGIAEGVFSNIFDGNKDFASNDRNDGWMHATSYAASATNSFARPKQKFLFKVDILFEQNVPEVRDFLSLINIREGISLNVVSIDRPKIDFEYEEVNKYNYRTKVLKNIKHRELTLTMIDNVGNMTFEFIKFFLMVNTGIMKRSAVATQDITQQKPYIGDSLGHGMVFSSGFGASEKLDFAARSVIDNYNGNMIRAIAIRQVSMRHYESSIKNAPKEVDFIFMNPRITNIDMDDMTYESSEFNTASFSFDYDYLSMVSSNSLNESNYNIPGWHTAPGDMSMPASTKGITFPNENPITKVLSAVGGRAAQKVFNETIGKELKKVPGLGNVTTQIGQVIGGAATSGLANAVPSLGELVSSKLSGIVRDRTGS